MTEIIAIRSVSRYLPNPQNFLQAVEELLQTPAPAVLPVATVAPPPVATPVILRFNPSKISDPDLSGEDVLPRKTRDDEVSRPRPAGEGNGVHPEELINPFTGEVTRAEDVVITQKATSTKTKGRLTGLRALGQDASDSQVALDSTPMGDDFAPPTNTFGRPVNEDLFDRYH